MRGPVAAPALAPRRGERLRVDEHPLCGGLTDRWQAAARLRQDLLAPCANSQAVLTTSTGSQTSGKRFYVVHPFCGKDGRFRVWLEGNHEAHIPSRLAPTRGGPWHPRTLCAEHGYLIESWRDSTPTGADEEPTERVLSIRRLRPAGDVVVHLPTQGSLPLPSPAAGGSPTQRGRMRPWVVGTWSGDGPQLWSLLHPFLPAEGQVRVAPEWPAWWDLAAHIETVVQRGAVVPLLRDGPDGLRAIWRPVLSAGERVAATTLAAAIPPACLPPADPNAHEMPQWLIRFIENCGDGAMRQLLAHQRDLTPWRHRPRGETRTAARWLAALFDPRSGALPLRGRQLARLRPWLCDPLGLEGPPGLVLQLMEPEGDGTQTDDRWQLFPYLSPPGEPGVLVPAADAWGAGPTGKHGGVLDRLLATAATAFPPLAAAAAHHENPVSLTTDEAWTLLTTAAPDLETQGVSLRLPAWWQAPPPKARLRLAAAQSSGLLGSDGLVEFSWEVALGGQTLKAAEFEALVAQRAPLVHLRTGWVAVSPQTARALAARWRAAREGQMGVGSAVLMALGAGMDLAQEGASPEGGAPGVEIVTDQAVEELMGGLSQPPAPIDAPPGFVGVLRPYQRAGAGWLAHRAALGLGGILADDMGLGKTVQLLAAVAHGKAAGRSGPVLVVAPTSVLSNWRAEAERFTPGMRTLVHQGAARPRSDALRRQAAAADLVVTSYALLLRDATTLRQIDWDGVVLDEAQNVKNASSKQAQAARTLPARWRLALTGTPVENSLSDLWSIFAFVQPGYLGPFATFRRRLALPAERGEAQALATLRRLMAPFVLRRSKRDPGVADELPDKIETVEECALTTEQAALYEGAIRELLGLVADSRGMERRAAVLLTLLRLKQICNHPAQYTGDRGALAGRSGKLDRLEELLAEVLAENEAALIFTQFPTFGRRLVAHLRDRWPHIPIYFLEGTTPAKRRAELVERFQALESGGAGVFVLSLKAGGAGLNLTAAQHVFHLDLWWNPAVERQATDRAHRIGQRHAVHVHRLICAGTLEERIDRLLRSKEVLAEGVLGTGDGWLTELSDAQLHDLVALRRASLQIPNAGRGAALAPAPETARRAGPAETHTP